MRLSRYGQLIAPLLCQSDLGIYPANASSIHGYFGNAKMKIMINNWKDAWKTAVDLLHFLEEKKKQTNKTNWLQFLIRCPVDYEFRHNIVSVV